MTIKEFEKEQAKILKDSEIRAAWLEYLSRFPHVSLYYRNAPQYKNQIARIRDASGKEKRAGTDVNLYKLFLEQCFNLLGEGGRCGLLLPTGVYTDLGAKQLREMLFTQSSIQSLFGLSNEKFLFEGVHHSFRICLLTFEKGGGTEAFEAAFRINPREAISAARLESFLHSRAEHLKLSTDLIRRFSPDSLSLMEFKSEVDIRIAERMFCFPLLGERISGSWNLRLVRELEKSKRFQHLLYDAPAIGRLPLFTGDMFDQMRLTGIEPEAWVDEVAGREVIGNDQYKEARWVHRRIARSTDSRTMISTIAPPLVFTESNSTTLDMALISASEMLFLCGLVNSFVFDWLLRKKVDDTISMFYLYQMPVPRLRGEDSSVAPLVSRVAQLVCTRPEFAKLWQEVRDFAWSPGAAATEPAVREQLRGELDGLMAHLYGLTEEEFAHVLSTFPVVPLEKKDAALRAYRALAPKTEDPELRTLLLTGEGRRVEFKSTARWDLKEGRKNPALEDSVLKTIAGFLNAQGGTLLLGVADDGSAVGIEHDYQTLQKKDRDGFGLFLADLVLGAAGRDLAPCVHWSFQTLAGKDVCRIDVQPSPRPVFLADGNDEVLWLRVGNSTRRLTTKEAMAYEKTRWGPQAEAGRSTTEFTAPRPARTGESVSAALALSPLFRPPQPDAAPSTAAQGPSPPPASPPVRSIAEYSRDQLKGQIEAVVGRNWTSRDDAIREAARRLGFRRTGSAIREAFESAIRGALRQGRLEASGDRIRCTPGS